MSRSSERAVLTIGTGGREYRRLAHNLARSYFRHAAASGIPFYLVTDDDGPLPEDLRDVSIIQVPRGRFGSGVTPKLSLDLLAPARQTLFLDADCLVVSPLDSLFDRFEGRSVSAVGSLASSGEWWGDIGTRCDRFGIDAVPVFVGSIYYVERGAAASAVFDAARACAETYERDGFVAFRGGLNEEPLVSVGMARHGLGPIEEDGTIKADAMFWSSVLLDLLRGRAEVAFDDTRYDLNRGCATAGPGRTAVCRPRVLHFDSRSRRRPPYTPEVLALMLASRLGWRERTCRAVATGMRALGGRW